MLEPLGSPESIVALIAQVSDTPTSDVARRLLSEAEEIGTVVATALEKQNIPRYVTSPALDEFYKDSDAFLYETTVWNCCRVKKQMREFIDSRLPAR